VRRVLPGVAVELPPDRCGYSIPLRLPNWGNRTHSVRDGVCAKRRNPACIRIGMVRQCPASVTGRTLMCNLLLNTCFGAAAVLAAGAANANEELIKMSQNPKDWVMPTGNYANHRYSQLKQINADNAGKLQVAWTFSTGVLRGHEGGPLVI